MGFLVTWKVRVPWLSVTLGLDGSVSGDPEPRGDGSVALAGDGELNVSDEALSWTGAGV